MELLVVNVWGPKKFFLRMDRTTNVWIHVLQRNFILGQTGVRIVSPLVWHVKMIVSVKLVILNFIKILGILIYVSPVWLDVKHAQMIVLVIHVQEIGLMWMKMGIINAYWIVREISLKMVMYVLIVMVHALHALQLGHVTLVLILSIDMIVLYYALKLVRMGVLNVLLMGKPVMILLLGNVLVMKYLLIKMNIMLINAYPLHV